MRSSTPARRTRRSSSGTAAIRSSSRSPTMAMAAAEMPASPRVGTGSSECASASPSTAAASMLHACRAAASVSRPSPHQMTAVLLCDDQALLRVGLRKILEAETDTEVVGEAGNGEDAVSMVERLRPDVVLMDIRMPVSTASRRRASRSRPPRHARSRPDHIRARQLRLRSAAGRRERLHAQGCTPGGDRRRSPDRRQRRGASRPRRHARRHRGVHTTAAGNDAATTSRTRRSDPARARGAHAAHARHVEPRDLP